MGEDATFSVVTNRTGSVTSINLLNGGEDYIAAPNVSLKVQDIVVSNVSISNLPELGDTLYQGANINVASYIATVNSISTLQFNEDPTLTLFNLRVFNYSSPPDPNLVLKIDRNINAIMANTAFNANYNQFGVRVYGDGNAKANASFLNGLVISQGQYLNSRGHPSSFDVLQSSIYNNYTYIVTVQKEIAKESKDAKTIEAQVATQGLVVGSMNFVPGFDAYKNALIPDINALLMARQYEKPVNRKNGV